MPARAGQSLEHRTLSGLLVEMHRLRVEFARELQYFVARDVARAERTETAGFEVFECQRGHVLGKISWEKLPEGSPIVAVISGNLNPSKCMGHEHPDSGLVCGLVRGVFQG